MTIEKTLAIALLGLLPLASVADSKLNPDSTIYRGHSQGKRICKAIVEDNSAALRKILYREQRLSYRGRKNELTRQIAGRFSCNDQSLLEFAETIEARGAAHFLSTGQVRKFRSVADLN